MRWTELTEQRAIRGSSSDRRLGHPFVVFLSPYHHFSPYTSSTAAFWVSEV